MSDGARRAFVSKTPAPGDRCDLDADESHHVSRVLRLKPGDPLAVFDGKGGEWDARIEALQKDRVTIAIGGARAGVVEPPVRVVVFQALARPEKIEWVLQKGTEIGVSSFRLIETDRVEAPPPSPARLSRFQRILMEACKQCGRRVLPTLGAGGLEAPGGDVVAILLSPAEASVPLSELLAGPRASEVWIAVGPEGGFTDDEVQTARASGWLQASLGPRVLRTETAGAVAAALVLHAWGDLGRSL